MSGYWTETDTLTTLKAEGETQYQEMVGVLRWAVYLGWVEILLETAIMSTYLAFFEIEGKPLYQYRGNGIVDFNSHVPLRSRVQLPPSE